MNLPVMTGPQLPAVLRLPAAATISSGRLMAITGWSRQRLHNYRERHGFPRAELIDGASKMWTRTVAAWFAQNGTIVEWL
ncbi:hypothetical protein [Aquamicrobium terrae]|uniref:AlpA family phage regulatory protein n=1 Tax=Aquamicrobium terrae TaxID=1324945 RepID=A0ABV2N2Q0_9HYPH